VGSTTSRNIPFPRTIRKAQAERVVEKLHKKLLASYGQMAAKCQQQTQPCFLETFVDKQEM
jgi:hypothetical protein